MLSKLLVFVSPYQGPLVTVSITTLFCLGMGLLIISKTTLIKLNDFSRKNFGLRKKLFVSLEDINVEALNTFILDNKGLFGVLFAVTAFLLAIVD